MKRDKSCADCGTPVTRTRCKSCAVRFRFFARGGTEIDRFWGRVDANGDCWLWTGGKADTGYGTVHIEGKTWHAHRVAYELLVGSIPVGLELDHLCRVRACVNPDHLEPVDHRTNLLRGASPAAIAFRTGICIRGHAVAGTNRQPNGRDRHGAPRFTCRSCRSCRSGNVVAFGLAL